MMMMHCIIMMMMHCIIMMHDYMYIDIYVSLYKSISIERASVILQHQNCPVILQHHKNAYFVKKHDFHGFSHFPSFFAFFKNWKKPKICEKPSFFVFFEVFSHFFSFLKIEKNAIFVKKCKKHCFWGVPQKWSKNAVFLRGQNFVRGLREDGKRFCGTGGCSLPFHKKGGQ